MGHARTESVRVGHFTAPIVRKMKSRKLLSLLAEWRIHSRLPNQARRTLGIHMQNCPSAAERVSVVAHFRRSVQSPGGFTVAATELTIGGTGDHLSTGSFETGRWRCRVGMG